MRTYVSVLGLAIGWVACSGGCAKPWRPPLEPAVQPPQPYRVDLSCYLAPPAESRSVFIRRSLQEPDRPADSYAMSAEADDVREGGLISADFLPVSRYLENNPAHRENAEAPFTSFPAFFLEFDPSLTYLPSRIEPEEVFREEATVRLFDRAGDQFYDGKASRETIMEGYEHIDVPAGSFPGCLRLRITSKCSFRWGPSVELTEYIWLAPRRGIVRRVAEVTATAFLIRIADVQVYELAAWETGYSVVPENRPLAGAVSKHCAVQFDRWLPRPRIGGLIIELSQPDSTAPAEVEGTLVVRPPGSAADR